MRLFIFLLACMMSIATHAEPAKTEPVGEETPITDEQKSVFDIMEYQVDGNTVLDKMRIEESVYPFMGPAKTIDDVEKARAALEKAFHDAGYLTVFVNIPEQEVTQGLVKLQVQEGKVDKLRVVGSRYYSLGAIKGKVPQFAEGNIPYFPAVKNELASVNSTADRQVAPVLRPSKTPGKVDVDLKVQDQLPFHGGIELNDRYSANTTRTRINGSLRYDNLWQLDHSLSISFQVTPENTDETKVISGTYVIPTSVGDYWAVYGVISDSNVASVGGSNVLGKGNIVGLRYIHPLPAVNDFSHSLTLGVDYKDFQQSSVSGTAPISYTPFYAGYDGTLRASRSTTQMGIGITLSVRGLGNDDLQFEAKKPFAQPSFIYMRPDIKHTQFLPGNWQFYARLAGQLSSQVLIPNEQFALGGTDSVRGYLEANSLGDQGIFGTLELRTPPLMKYLPGVDASEFYARAFYDAGHANTQIPQFVQTRTFNLASVGFGLFLKKWYGLSTTLDYAHALHSAGNVGTADYVTKGDDRLHFRISYDW